MTDEELIAKAREHGSLITNEPYFNRPLLESKPQTREFAVVYFEGNNDSQMEIYLDKRTGAFIGATTSPRSEDNRPQNTPASKAITMVGLVDVFSNPTTSQLWIVPGIIEDNEDRDGLNMHITEYLQKRGIHVSTHLTGPHYAKKEEEITNDIKRKFESQGYTVFYLGTAND